MDGPQGERLNRTSCHTEPTKIHNHVDAIERISFIVPTLQNVLRACNPETSLPTQREREEHNVAGNITDPLQSSDAPAVVFLAVMSVVLLRKAEEYIQSRISKSKRVRVYFWLNLS